jgi:hypothetical protein
MLLNCGLVIQVLSQILFYFCSVYFGNLESLQINSCFGFVSGLSFTICVLFLCGQSVLIAECIDCEVLCCVLL